MGMARHARLQLGGNLFPEDLSRAFVQAVNLKLMLGEISALVELTGERVLEDGLRIAGNGGGYKDPVAPDNWTRVSEARNGRAPRHVAMRCHIPGNRNVARRIEDSRGARPPEGWPVLAVGSDRQNEDEDDTRSHRLRHPLSAKLKRNESSRQETRRARTVAGGRPRPKIGINDVLIQVLRASICGTDVHIYNWDAWAQQTIPVPMVIGP